MQLTVALPSNAASACRRAEAILPDLVSLRVLGSKGTWPSILASELVAPKNDNYAPSKLSLLNIYFIVSLLSLLLLRGD